MLRGCIRDAERCLTGAEVEGVWGKCIGMWYLCSIRPGI